MSAKIHPTAVVDSAARIGRDVEIGPYAVIEGAVVLGERCRIGPHACLRGPLELGPDNRVGIGALLGHDPQVRGTRGPFGGTRIGARNVFREYVQVHRSMRPEGETRIGDGGYFMAASHVAHDCVIGEEVTVCNGVLLAGHVAVGDRAFLSGYCMVHQFCRIGRIAMVGGGATVNLDAPPFGMLVGARPAILHGLNVVGVRRAGIASAVRRELRAAFRALFRSDLPIPERLAALRPESEEVAHLLGFVRESRRGVHGLAPARVRR